MELCDSILEKIMAQNETFSSRDDAPAALLAELDEIVKEAV
jgi:hypothetical protein